MFDAARDAVGGHVALLPGRPGYALSLNEDGWNLRMPTNLGAMVFLLKLGCVPAQIPVGPLAICGLSGERWIGLTDAQVAELREIDTDIHHDRPPVTPEWGM
jgi:hypothetical protein